MHDVTHASLGHKSSIISLLAEISPKYRVSPDEVILCKRAEPGMTLFKLAVNRLATLARREFCYRAIKDTLVPIEQISRLLNREHKTVIQSARAYARANKLELPKRENAISCACCDNVEVNANGMRFFNFIRWCEENGWRRLKTRDGVEFRCWECA